MTDSRRETVGWTCVGMALLVTWLGTSRALDVEGIPHPHGLAALVDLSFLVTPAGAAILTTLYVASLVAIVLGRHRAIACALVSALLGLVTHVVSCQWEGGAVTSAHATAMGGAATFVYAAGASWLDERRAREAVVGIVAASYVLAGTSKLWSSGLHWAESANVGLHIASHALAHPSFLTPLRLAAATNAPFMVALGVGTLVIECSFVAFVFPRLRPLYAVIASAMHLSISLLMGLHHEEWMLMVIGTTLLTRQVASATTATTTTIHSGSK